MAKNKADGQKTEESTSAQNDGEVKLTQEKLDSLINEKFAKGAEKAQKQLLEKLGLESIDSLEKIVKDKKELDEKNKSELEKLQEQLRVEAESKEHMKAEAEKLKKSMALKDLAFKNNVKDLEFLEFEHNKASSKEDFNEDNFIKELKSKKPYIFKDIGVHTDNTPNKDSGLSQSDKLKKLSFEELRQLAIKG